MTERPSISWQSLEPPLLPKVHVRVEEFIALPSKNQLERDCASGSLIDMDGKDLERGMAILNQDPGPNRTHKDVSRAMIISGLAPAETKPTQQSVYITLKPSAALDVDIAAIAAALEVTVKKADMAGVMQEHAFRCARQCLKTTEKLLSKQTAYTLKKEFDRVYGPPGIALLAKALGLM
ncbi:hypothetical protein L7F22_013267 [Adiantum nelumboides]|nr:hypothetical protein [Adiantum nelumboides]